MGRGYGHLSFRHRPDQVTLVRRLYIIQRGRLTCQANQSNRLKLESIHKKHLALWLKHFLKHKALTSDGHHAKQKVHHKQLLQSAASPVRTLCLSDLQGQQSQEERQH